MKDKLLILTFTFHPYSTISSFRMLRFARYLPEYGIEPYVITAKHSKTVSDSFPNTRYIKTLFSYRYESPLNPIRFQKKRVSFIKISNYLIRLVKDIITSPDKHLFWSIMIIPDAVRTIKKEKINTLLVTGDPFSLFIAGMLIKTLSGVKLILDYRDPWLSNRMNRIQTFLRRFMNARLQSICLKAADLVMSVYGFVLEELPVDKSRTFWLPNGYDPEFFKNIKPVTDKENEVFTFIYAGKIDVNTGYYNPVTLLKGYQLFREENPSYKTKIVMFGQVSRETQETLAEKNLLQNVELAGLVTPREVIEHAARSDALLQYIAPMKSSEQIASKLYEYLMLEKPIISVNKETGAIAELLSETRAGYACENDEIETIASLFKKVYELDKKKFRQQLDKEKISRFDARLQTGLLAKKIKELSREA